MNQMWNANIQRNLTRNLLVEVPMSAAADSTCGPTSKPTPSIRSTRRWDRSSPRWFPILTTARSRADSARPRPLQPVTAPLLALPGHQLDSRLGGRFGLSRLYAARRETLRRRAAVPVVVHLRQADRQRHRALCQRRFGRLRQSLRPAPQPVPVRPGHLPALVSNFVYELPFGKGKRFLGSGPLGWVVGHWRPSGIINMQTGTPCPSGPPAPHSCPASAATTCASPIPGCPAGSRP